MLPLSDGLPARRFPVVTIALIPANLAVWIPHIGGFVFGWLVARALLDAERIRPQSVPRHSALTPFRTG